MSRDSDKNEVITVTAEPVPSKASAPTSVAGAISIKNIPIEISIGLIKEIADVYKIGIECFTDYLTSRQQEETERLRIRECARAIEKKLEYDQELRLKILEDNSKEKNRLYDSMEKSLDVALKNNDTAFAQVVIKTMMDLYKYDKNMPLLQSLGSSQDSITLK
ncbi:MAG: hypothetical protein LKE33_07375 [Acidaminococcus sp.]|jgi:hypothetical protein|nr:hypothetical protein [Acidaminococcus sp.]MCI2099830.1 hypothetical protein [Acidaminococcus sp.]MCI2114058.1 hypothetical protein [Acidaminococcus sp.]MCI2115928.1 hypothetical protein [Acidaminococcus sp.]